MVVLDAANRVFISTQPKRYPLQADLASLDRNSASCRRTWHEKMATWKCWSTSASCWPSPWSPRHDPGHPGAGASAGYYRASFDRVLKRTAWTTLIVLLVLLRSPGSGPPHGLAAIPADRAYGGTRSEAAGALADRLYTHSDELGRLFLVYDQMRQELADKEALERQM